MTARVNSWRIVVRILCALALFSVGFAHKTPALAAPLSPAEIVAYSLPDGTLPDLCLPGQDEDGGKGGHVSDRGCEACRIAAAALLPTPQDTVGRPIRRAATIELRRPVEAFFRQLFPPNAAPRAPPVSPLTA